jgi:very-short-patch-repair endonuclease
MEAWQWLLLLLALYFFRKWWKKRKWLENQCTNRIERRVYRYLRKRKIIPIPQYRVKSEKSWYKLDFKIGRVDLEIDGPFHETTDGRMRDHKRDAYLKRYGWHVIRIPYRELHKNFEGTMKQVVRHLKKQKLI